MKKLKGFTLPELLVVMAIIALGFARLAPAAPFHPERENAPDD